MAANAGTVNITLRVKDDGSVVIDRFGKGVEKEARRVESSMAKASKQAMALKTTLLSLGAGVAIKSLWDMGLATERMDKAFTAIAKGDARKAGDEIAFIRAKADELGLEFYTTIDSYKNLYAASQDSILAGQATRDIFVAITEAGAALGMSNDAVSGSLNAIQQMMSKGNVQAEELRGQLGERLPGAFNLAAQAMGKSTEELNKMLDNGEVLASDLLPKLARVLHEKYGQAAIDASDGAVASWNRFVTAFKDDLADLANSGFMDLGIEMLRGMTGGLKDLSGWVKNNRDEIESFFKSLGILLKGLGTLGGWIGNAVGWIPGWASDLGAAMGMVASGSIQLSAVATANREELRKLVESFDLNPVIVRLNTQKDILNASISQLQAQMKIDLFDPDLLNNDKAILAKKLDELELINKRIAEETSRNNPQKQSAIPAGHDPSEPGGINAVVFPEGRTGTGKDNFKDSKARLAVVMDELRQRIDLQQEFNGEYQKLTLSRSAYESMQIEAMGRKYVEAGADEIQVARWVAEQKIQVSDKWRDGAVRALDDYADSALDAAANVESFFGNAMSGMEDAFVRLRDTGKLAFGEMVDSMINDIIRLTVRMSITGPIAQALAAGMSSYFSGYAGTGTGSYTSADGSFSSTYATYDRHGNAYGPAGQYAFAKGGIVDRPTRFRFGQGGALAGIMGEAGAEGILPLGRTKSGDLGVKTTGGSSPVVNVSIVNNASGARGMVTSQAANASGGVDIEVLVDQIDGALAARAASGRSAFDRLQQGKYGLNPAYGVMR